MDERKGGGGRALFLLSRSCYGINISFFFGDTCFALLCFCFYFAGRERRGVMISRCDDTGYVCAGLGGEVADLQDDLVGMRMRLCLQKVVRDGWRKEGGR